MYYQNDYLRGYHDHPATVTQSGQEILLSNGIASRRFTLTPDFSCISLQNLYSGEEFLRSIKPEITLTIDGEKYPVGGVKGQFERAFLKAEWLSTFTADQGFRYLSHEVTSITRSFGWEDHRSRTKRDFPPKGKCLHVTFQSDLPQLKGIMVTVHYELYDDLPAFGKSFTLYNNSGREILLNEFEAEILAITEHDTNSELSLAKTSRAERNIFVTSDIENQYTPTFGYELDPEYTSQVDFNCLSYTKLVSKPQLGPHKRIANGESFDSFTAFMMLYDETDRARRTLQISRFYQTLAPWTTENPIYVHIISNDEEELRAAVDQCVATGFEMIIISFGSDVDMENTSPENIAKFKRIADYAHQNGIEIGCYSLLASRELGKEHDVVNDNIIFGHSPCLGSKWGEQYMKNIRTFIEQTGFDVLEHDGSYPGDTCASTSHPGHECYEDSLYTQLMTITKFYNECRDKGIYLTVPDHYYLAGNTKCCMGYKEVNWSLPRMHQQIIARQNIYDGTHNKLPTMGWMFVPLTEYHGGGAAATIEPLCEHLDHYRMMLNNNLMAGVQASYRGKRIYDTDETKAMVKDSIDIYKAHRAIFESPIVHLRRPDGRDYDGYLHVNPDLDEKGMLVLFNPLNEDITPKIRVPLTFTGIEGMASVAPYGENAILCPLNRDDTATVQVTVPANDYTWLVIKQA